MTILYSPSSFEPLLLPIAIGILPLSIRGRVGDRV